MKKYNTTNINNVSNVKFLLINVVLHSYKFIYESYIKFYLEVINIMKSECPK